MRAENLPAALVGGSDGTVRVRRLDGTLQEEDGTFSKLHRCRSEGYAEPKALLALPGDQGHALVGWTDGTVTLFDANDGAILSTFEPHPPELRGGVPHTFEVTRLALMSGDRFVSGSTDKTTRITEYGRALDDALKAKRKAEAVQMESKVASLEA